MASAAVRVLSCLSVAVVSCGGGSSKPNVEAGAGTSSTTGSSGTSISTGITGTNGATSTTGTTGGVMGCPSPNGQTVKHQADITSNETWAGDGTIHEVTFGFVIRPGATLTLAACAVVQVDAGLSLTISGDPGNPAKVVSAGTVDQPVLITSKPGSQSWGFLRSYSPDGTAELSYTTLENGGNATYHGATLHFRAGGAVGTALVPMVKVDHVTVKGSAGTGIVFEGGAAFTSDSAELTIVDGGAVAAGTPPPGDSAIELTPLAAGTLPTLHASGNVIDQVRIADGSLYISRDLTLKNVGVPYYFYFDRVRVTDQTGSVTPTLTVEPGVTMRFDDYLVIGYASSGAATQPGKLIAIGGSAPDQHIVFTSSKPVPVAGDWPGVFLLAAPGSTIQNADITYAGGFNGIVSANCKPDQTSDNAGIFIGSKDGTYIPAASDFANVTIDASASHGINAMWTSADFGPDLTTGFQFGTINGCRQTKSARTTGCGTEAGCLVP